MKKACSILPVICIAFACLGSLGCRIVFGIPATGWQIVGKKAFTDGGTAAATALLRIGTTGATAVAYTQTAADGISTGLYVKTWNGTSWIPAGINPICASIITVGTGTGYAMVIDSQGNPVVGYADSSSNIFSVVRFNGSSWDPVASMDLSLGRPSAGYYLAEDMAMGPGGNLRLLAQVSYYPSYQHVLFVQGGTTFSLETKDPALFGFSEDMRLSYDASGAAFVAFTTGFGGIQQGKLAVRTWAALPGWQDIGPGEQAEKNPGPVIFDAAGAPYIVFSPPATSGFFAPKVMKYSGGGTSWLPVGDVPVSTENKTADYALAFTGSNLFVALQESTFYSEMSLFGLSGTSWTSMGRRAFSNGNPAGMPSLAIDSTGTPMVAFVETGNANKVSVYKYVGGAH